VEHVCLNQERGSFVSNELHVAGVLVQLVPACVESVARTIAMLPGADVHARSPDGKLVVTLETQDPAGIMTHLNHIREIRGVLSALLVYEHSEPLDSIDEEVDYEDHAP
jgi:periplasmic nitrate reductase NapD